MVTSLILNYLVEQSQILLWPAWGKSPNHHWCLQVVTGLSSPVILNFIFAKKISFNDVQNIYVETLKKSVILIVFTITDIDPSGLYGHVRQGISLILS